MKDFRPNKINESVIPSADLGTVSMVELTLPLKLE